jgi:hypothetical protein
LCNFRPIQFNEKVQPISLWKEPVTDGSIITLTGWGLLSANGKSPNLLHTIDLNYVNNEKCKELHSVENREAVGKGHLCTFTKGRFLNNHFKTFGIL